MLEKIKDIGENILGFLRGLIAIVIGYTLSIFVGMIIVGFITLCLEAL